MTAPLVRSPDADAETAEEKMSQTQEIIVSGSEAEQAPLMPAPAGLRSILEVAVTTGASVEIIRELMALQREADADRARKAFDEALSAAKGEIPVIAKNREVDFTSSKGRTNYRHEDFAEIARTVDPVLKRHGLSYRFRVSSEQNQPVAVTCILAHRDGHFEETTLHAGRDESGNKNSIQAVGSTITYLQRYTLKAALGLAASSDDDGKAVGAGETITEEQVKHLRSVIAEVDADEASFVMYMRVKSLDELPAKQYDRAIAALSMKREKAKS